MDEKTAPGYVCSKKYPFLKKHAWYVIITDAAKERLIQIEKIIAVEGNKAIFEMKQRFGQQGHFTFNVMVMNDSYVGFDKEFVCEFDIVDEDKTRTVEKTNQEDIDAVKGPGMLQSMLENAQEESEGEESSDDGLDALKAKLEKAGMKDAATKRGEKKPEETEKKSKVSDDNQLLS